MRLYDRDRDSAGTVVSSAIAFRLFLFFVPMLLFVVGVLGFFAEHVDGGRRQGAGDHRQPRPADQHRAEPAELDALARRRSSGCSAWSPPGAR